MRSHSDTEFLYCITEGKPATKHLKPECTSTTGCYRFGYFHKGETETTIELFITLSNDTRNDHGNLLYKIKLCLLPRDKSLIRDGIPKDDLCICFYEKMVISGMLIF